MAHPYVPSGAILQSAIVQFRRSFPAKVDSETLKKLAVASGNESGVINVLKFLKLVGDDNLRTADGQTLFTEHADDAFGNLLADHVRDSYVDLFDLRGEDAWNATQEELISFFRRTDQTSAVVGKRQAITFQTLASLTGKRAEEIAARSRSPKPKSGSDTAPKGKATPGPKIAEPRTVGTSEKPTQRDVALTVRVEINLPANASREAYDDIFASIKKNLLNGHAS